MIKTTQDLHFFIIITQAFFFTATRMDCIAIIYYTCNLSTFVKCMLKCTKSEQNVDISYFTIFFLGMNMMEHVDKAKRISIK